jgi:signal transduction histidine kinase
MSAPLTLNQRERELAAIISAYSEVTQQLRQSHERLNDEVRKLRQEVENKNRELARRERLAALGEMATGVAHEIRNPLGSIQLFASLLERDLQALPQAQRLVRKISCGVDSLDRIVGDILDFAGHREPRPDRVALAALIAGAVDAAQGRVQQRQATVEVDAVIGDAEVWADRAQLERVVLNVVLNALDASPEKGRVYIGVRRGGDWVAIDVLDQGPGVPDAVMERIFNPFFTTKEHGTGLGLAIVHRIMESHGGAVRVQNRPEGGACFTLQLPSHNAVA